MKHCLITYEEINDNEIYSQRGLKKLAPALTCLHPLEFSADEQRKEAVARVGKMSVQGVQNKLSAKLKVKEGRFEIVDTAGNYILKPQNVSYPELPENEAITMTLAERIGIDVPAHGLVYSKDNSLTYFIKRFDRVGHGKKISQEDFSQLLSANRDTKYNSSMEKVVSVIANHCTFPKIEYVKLLKLTLFNYLVGNEDMHLKNFSLVMKENKVMLSPAYDLINTTIALQAAKEEMALPLNGKKNNLLKRDLLEYFALELMSLNQVIVNQIVADIQQAMPSWIDLINVSFLSANMKIEYLNLLRKRTDLLLG